jgi:protein arginine N-methyltransferase 3
MPSKTHQNEIEEKSPYKIEQEEDDDEEEQEVWDDWEGDEGDSEFICLFCDSNYTSCTSLFQHCSSIHHFDFHTVTNSLHLDFYASFKLINYIRSQVTIN